MTAVEINSTIWQPLNKFLAARRVELKRDYPEADAEEVKATLVLDSERWFREVQQYQRGATVPAGVIRSFCSDPGPCGS